MFKKKSPVNREVLGFKEEVLAAFGFLIDEYGFRVVEQEPTRVRFESPLVFLNVYHGRSSSELGLEVGQLEKRSSQLQSRYYLSDILDLIGKAQEEGYTFFQASTQERVKKYIAQLAELVKKHAKNVLKGDSAVFENLRSIQARKSQEYLKEMNLSRIRPEANEAFRKRDYSRVIELLEPVRTELNPSELRKLGYARKHVNSA
jgi:hypothetical protein